jgi:hypothetical protein
MTAILVEEETDFVENNTAYPNLKPVMKLILLILILYLYHYLLSISRAIRVGYGKGF